MPHNPDTPAPATVPAPAPARAPAAAHPPPADAAARRAAAPVVVYPTGTLAPAHAALLTSGRAQLATIATVEVPPRDARTMAVPAGHYLRIHCPDGPQVGDLNLWAAADPAEHFFSGKTRALHATHVTTGDRLWSRLPWLRPMATVTHDSLDWYGVDADGARVHDVIGTRCDPYTNHLLHGTEYHRCCHSNLARALAVATQTNPAQAEMLVHDVVNVFMCTGFTRDTGQYFMKASPVRAGDYLEIFAEIDLLVGLSACPGGDCGATHSSDAARCHALGLEVLRPAPGALGDWQGPQPSAYGRSHGL